MPANFVLSRVCKLICEKFLTLPRFLKKINNPLKEFAIGETIMKVDTTDFKTVDFDKLMEAAYSFIYND